MNNLSTSQVSIGTTATKLASENSNRRGLLIVNNSASNIFVGNSGVTTSNGMVVTANGGNIEFSSGGGLFTTAEVYAIVSTGTATVMVLEV